MSPDRQRLVLAFGQLLFQVVDVLSALAEAAVGEDALLQRDVGLDAVDDHFAQRHAHAADGLFAVGAVRSEEHTSELQSLMRISYAVFCLQQKKQLHAKEEIRL